MKRCLTSLIVWEKQDEILLVSKISPIRKNFHWDNLVRGVVQFSAETKELMEGSSFFLKPILGCEQAQPRQLDDKDYGPAHPCFPEINLQIPINRAPSWLVAG